MSRTVAGWIGFLGGLIGGYCIIFFGWVAYTDLSGVFDRDGGKMMGIAFFFAPIGAVVTGVACAIWLARRAARKAEVRGAD